MPPLPSLEGTIGIIAACIPTIKPLFNPSRRNSHGRIRRIWSHTDKEDKHRLHETVINLDYLSSSPSSSSSPAHVDAQGRNYVEISGGKNVTFLGETILEGNHRRTNGVVSDREGEIRKETSFLVG